MPNQPTDTDPAATLPALALPCPACGAAPGQPCTSHSGTRIRRHNVHQARTKAHSQSQESDTTLYFEAPNYYQPRPADPPRVFLAGGITNCPDWQPEAAAELLDVGFIVFNPRRRRWPIGDADQTPVQIAWEVHHLQLAAVTMFWFPPCDAAQTTQPITMYELGAAAATADRRIVVGADPGYPRVADVHVQLGHARPGLTVHSTLDATIQAARDTLTSVLPARTTR